MNLQIHTHTFTPLAFAKKDIDSDHTPVRSRISPKKLQRAGDAPIPKWIAKHPIFQEQLSTLLADYNEELASSPYEAANDLKLLFREASRTTIKQMFRKPAKHVKRDLPEIGQHLDLAGDTI